MLGLGTVALVAQAAGPRKRREPSVQPVRAAIGAVRAATLIAGSSSLTLLRAVAADAATASAGIAYLYAYTPGLALQFALVALGSALRGTGIVRPTMLVQMLTVVVNIVLAPVLIAGWGTGRPLGAAGAGLASSLAIGVGVVLLWIYFVRLEHYVSLSSKLWRPQWATIRGILNIGLPAGGEFFMMFVILGVIYWVIRGFGPAAQAGFGIGGRMMQALFLPVMALAFGATPLAGQNFGARHYERVRATFWHAAILSSILMLGLTLVCQLRPQLFIQGFSRQPEVVAVGAEYLRIISWNFVATGRFSSSGPFQALAIPAVAASLLRRSPALPAFWLSMPVYRS
jgi:putative MATE family efflux protein